MVVRYNTLYSSPGHYFLDAIGGGENFTFEGFGNKDSDIYGNYISDAYDEAIESDGGNRNVRIWGNFMTHVGAAGISTAAVSVGPVYVYKNIIDNVAGMFSPSSSVDTASRAIFLKVGTKNGALAYQQFWDNGVAGGRTYVFHNTVLQPTYTESGTTYKAGVEASIEHAGGNTCNIVAYNNIFSHAHDWRSNIIIDQRCGNNDVDYNLHDANIAINCPTDGSPCTNGVPIIPGGNDIRGVPTYTQNLDSLIYRDDTYDFPDGWVNEVYKQYVGKLYLSTFDISTYGDYSLAPGSLGRGVAAPLPNFNDDYALPDMGAGQNGAGNLEFGVDAYR